MLIKKVLIFQIFLFSIFISFNNSNVMAIEKKNSQNIEVGLVTWKRDFYKSLALAKKVNKPVLALFQEVPGCIGCKNFGKEVLSDIETVKFIEENFIPILVYNNRKGADADILRKFKEPSWNFQVIRFLDHNANDIIPRKDRIWGLSETKSRIKKALKVFLEQKNKSNNTSLSELAFSMHCFWTGEAKLGALDGVYKTEAGFIKGQEVTKVWYNSNEITSSTLISFAQNNNLVDNIYSFKNGDNGYRKAPDSDQKRQLKGTQFENANLTDFQKTKINAYIRVDKNKMRQFLNNKQDY